MISFMTRDNIVYLIYLFRGFVSKTIMSEQTNMQDLLTWQPLFVLEELEEEFPEWREIMVSAMCLCADKRIVSSYAEDLYGPMNEIFSRKLLLHFIFCGLKF
jgi:hypothetical protein